MARLRTLVLFVVLAALWGTSFVATRAGLPYIPPVLFAALRFDIAGTIMLAYALVSTDRWRPRAKEEWTTVALGGSLFVAAHHALLFVGQQYVTSAVAAVVISLDPVLAVAFAYLLLPDERFTSIGGVGLGFGVLGVGVIAQPAPGVLVTTNVLGVALVFGAAAAFALGAVLTRRFRTTLPVQSLQAWMMLTGAPLLHATSFILPDETIAAIEWTETAIVALVYLGVVAAGVGYLLYFELLDRLGPVEINLVGYLVPVFAALGGWLVLGEQLAVTTMIGFASIFIGFALIKREAFRAELLRLRQLFHPPFE